LAIFDQKAWTIAHGFDRFWLIFGPLKNTWQRNAWLKSWILRHLKNQNTPKRHRKLFLMGVAYIFLTPKGYHK
jgi:hypothetical protein